MAIAVNLCIEQYLHLTELYISLFIVYIKPIKCGANKNFNVTFCTFDSLNSSVFASYSMVFFFFVSFFLQSKVTEGDRKKSFTFFKTACRVWRKQYISKAQASISNLKRFRKVIKVAFREAFKAHDSQSMMELYNLTVNKNRLFPSIPVT